jgi:Flp pilus assembly protein TadD
VALAGQARYGEADILLREAIAEDAGMAAAYNNLGVVCELTGRRDEAFNRYSAACLRERDNTVFRNKFLGFADSGAGMK